MRALFFWIGMPFLVLPRVWAAEPHLSCAQYRGDAGTVVLININVIDTMSDAVRKAAAARGEHVAIFPMEGQDRHISTETIYTALDELKRCGAHISSFIVTGHDGGGYYWGGTSESGFDHSDLMNALRHYPSVTSTLHSTYFWGCNSNARGTLLGIYRPSYRAADPGATGACGPDDDVCLRHQKNFDPYFKGAFPVNTTWGDDQAALNNGNPIARHYLYDLLTQEKSLERISDAGEFLRRMNEIRCNALTYPGSPRCKDPTEAARISDHGSLAIAGGSGDCFYHHLEGGRGKPAHTEVSDLSKPPTADFCKQELHGTYDGKLLQPLLEARNACSGKNCKKDEDFRDITDDTDHGQVREIYEFFYGNSDCQLISDPIHSQFPNGSYLRDLTFYNQIRDAILANHSAELERLNSDIISLGSLGSLMPPIETLSPRELSGKPPRVLTRAQLLDKLRRMQVALGHYEDRLSDTSPVQLLPDKLKSMNKLLDAFYRLLAIDPPADFTNKHCASSAGASRESCSIDSLIPPGWAEGSKQRSPIFSD